MHPGILNNVIKYDKEKINGIIYLVHVTFYKFNVK